MESQNVSVQALHRYFVETLKKFVEYAHYIDLIQDKQVVTEKITNFSPLFMDLLSQFPFLLLDSDHVKDGTYIMDFFGVFVDRISEKFSVPEFRSMLIALHHRNYEQKFKAYRYVECLIKISVEHKKILSHLINTSTKSFSYD